MSRYIGYFSSFTTKCYNCGIELAKCKNCHSESGNWYCSKKCYEDKKEETLI